MRKLFQVNWFVLWLSLAVASMFLGAGAAKAVAPDSNSVASLRAKYAELGDQLSNNEFKRPLSVASMESDSNLKADIYTRVDYPFAAVSEALTDPRRWCDLLILHLNTKHCRAGSNQGNSLLAVSIGRKHFQALSETSRVEFAYRVAANTPDYFDVELKAAKGPLETSDYRIELEATPLEGGKTFLHLTYSYTYNFAGRLAMQSYLATLGSDKVGFTRVGTQSDGQPSYIDGVRGVVERNTMRYYLAIDAYLDALSAPPAQQFEKRLRRWFALTELYPRQLHEVDLDTYLGMKRREFQRMQKPS